MPVLSNARHERFAQELAKGKAMDAAYIAAGYNPSRKNAQRLRTNEGVARRLEELQERAAKKAEVTAESIAVELEEDRQLAHKVKQAGAAVSATATKAKLFGLIKNKHEHSGPNGGPIKHDLSGLSDEHLAQLEAILGTIAGFAHAGGRSGGTQEA